MTGLNFEVITVDQLFENRELTDDRSREEAESLGRVRARRETAFLQKYVDQHVLSKASHDQIRREETAAHMAELLAQKELGLRNDPSSEIQGINVLLVQNDRTRFLIESTVDFIESAAAFVVPVPHSVSEPFWGLRAPEGAFCERATGESVDLNIWPRARLYGDGSPDTRYESGSLPFFDSDVVRIEDYAGALWQNPRYTPTGQRAS